LGLKVIAATPDAHDREMAAVQGLTHMIAKILLQMEPLPKAMTTRSFEHIAKAVDMVRYDSEELFMAIERENPHSAKVRNDFFRHAGKLSRRLLHKG
jgi:prephenate dehydrogenase